MAADIQKIIHSLFSYPHYFDPHKDNEEHSYTRYTHKIGRVV